MKAPTYSPVAIELYLVAGGGTLLTDNRDADPLWPLCESMYVFTQDGRSSVRHIKEVVHASVAGSRRHANFRSLAGDAGVCLRRPSM